MCEQLQKQKLLILIHPDCISEVGANEAAQYTKLLQQHLPKFNYVITHLFFPDDRPWSNSWDQQQIAAHRELFETIKRFSVALHNTKDIYGTSYDKELPDFLIENPNTDIYMAGGYESNCLWRSYLLLFQKMNWLLKEQGHKVSYYTPLIFTDRHGGGLARTTKYPPRKEQYPFNPNHVGWNDEFHPEKVNYKDTLET